MRNLLATIACVSIPVLLSAEPQRSVTPHWTLPTEPAVGWDSGDYAYDHSGNIVKIGKDTFAYDGVNRLTASTVTAYGVSTSQKFEYDRYGNMTVADGTASNGAACRETLAVQTSTNRLTQTCECGVCQTWTFDDAGNQTAYGTALTYRWDAAGSMTELKGPVAHERYVYDANDERVLLVSLDQNHEVVRRWTWRDASNKVAREAVEHVGSDVWTESRDYVYRNGTLLASFESAAAPVAERHYHVDHLGTPRLITDNTRRKLAVETYMPFGGRALGSDASYIGFQDRMRFTGHERDGEGSAYRPTLDYMHARYYTPDWGRFVSVDPVVGDRVNPQSWNGYSYTRNNPLRFTDPAGRQVACANEPDVCKPEAPKPTPEQKKQKEALDAFLFGSLTKTSALPIRDAKEVIGLIGLNSKTGPYAGLIGAIGGEFGSHANYLGIFKGVEITTDSPHLEIIDLREVAIGLEIPLVSGFGVGVGDYKTEREQGYFGFLTGEVGGQEVSVGVGGSKETVRRYLAEPPPFPMYYPLP